MSSKKTLKLGTRKSLLAWAQSSWVARQLENTHPGLVVELVGIETQGDKIQDKPLSQIDGKEFFTAELDLALLKGDVDLTVHSMKDLSLDRPTGIILAATPKRELSHDVIVFHASVIDRIKNNEEIRIGTSSPRRLTLIPSFLKEALPRFSPAAPSLRFVEIRGNVNTRLGRIHEPSRSERKLDGVVLAFAGLERLAMDQEASKELWRLFENTKLMVLPLKDCPTAPAQGALAIEAHRNQPDTVNLIRALHDERTLNEVKIERAILEEWGGGCHQKLGASIFFDSLYIKGKKDNGDQVNEIRPLKSSGNPEDQSAYTKIEAADVFNFSEKKLTAQEIEKFRASPFVFVAHIRAYEFAANSLSPEHYSNKRVWVSGAKSWIKLAHQGIWVEGCLEGRGFDRIDEFRSRKLLRMGSQSFAFLSHDQSPTEENQLIATYTHEFREIPKKVFQNDHLYWASGLPFEAIWSRLETPQHQEEFKKKIHACGPGRTAKALQAKGIEPRLMME